MSETKKIEQATAEGFLALFNDRFGCDYHIDALGDSPDVRCVDSNGLVLNLEVTLTEDRPRDIQALLGRSDHRDIKAMREHLGRVAERKEVLRASSLSGNVLEQLKGAIEKKLLKAYGQNTALVVRDTSGVDWDWDPVVKDVSEKIKKKRNPYDKGIWILSRSMDKLFEVTPGAE